MEQCSADTDEEFVEAASSNVSLCESFLCEVMWLWMMWVCESNVRSLAKSWLRVWWGVWPLPGFM